MPANRDQNPDASARTGSGEPLRFALVRFDGPQTAATQFAAVCESRGGVPWLQEVGVVERHGDGNLVLRGCFAGRYVDVDERDHVSEPGAGRGATIGGVLGALLGPPGIAVGLVLGAAAGSQVATPTEREPEPERLTERLRGALAPGTSALVMVAGPSEVAEMLQAIGPDTADVTQRALSAEAQAALAAELDSAVPVSPAGA